MLHGDATKAVLTNSAWESQFHVESNPNLKLIEALQSAGVEVVICGQALSNKKIAPENVAPNIPVATAALSVLMNRQAKGYAYLIVP